MIRLSETPAIELSLDTASVEGWIFGHIFFNMGQVISSLSAGLFGCKRRLLRDLGVRSPDSKFRPADA